MFEVEYICELKSREVFERAKDSILNHPFVYTKITKNIFEDIVEFEIKQTLGIKIMKVISSKQHLNCLFNSELLYSKIEYYKELVISIFTNWVKKIFSLNNGFLYT